MHKIKVYSGKSIQVKCGPQMHPENEVIYANKIIKGVSESKNILNLDFYSNCPDFVSAMKYIGLKYGIKVEFFLDGISHENDIEPLFEDFNKSLDLINELGLTEG